MTQIQFKFDEEKAVAAILYIASRIDSPTFLSIFKLMYLADKTSLERFGRFICGNNYAAMKNGPVPTEVYDMLRDGDNEHRGFTVVNNYHVLARTKPNLDMFSESDVECLDLVLENYGRLPVWHLIQLSHDTAWQRAWQA